MQREGRTRNGDKGPCHSALRPLLRSLHVWGFEWALWLGRAAQPGLMTPLVISPGLIQTRTGAGLVGWLASKRRWIAGMAGIPIAVCFKDLSGA